MKIYYAHPVSDYGSEIETHQIELLTKLGFEVLNPNEPEHQNGYEIYGMSYFTGLISSCNALAFSPFSDGTIGAGVAEEIERAIFLGLPVIELPQNIDKRTLSVEDTRRKLKKLNKP